MPLTAALSPPQAHTHDICPGNDPTVDDCYKSQWSSNNDGNGNAIPCPQPGAEFSAAGTGFLPSCTATPTTFNQGVGTIMRWEGERVAVSSLE